MIHIYNPLKFPYNLNYSKNYMSVMRPLDIGKVKKNCLVTACIHLFRSRVQLYSSILGFY